MEEEEEEEEERLKLMGFVGIELGFDLEEEEMSRDGERFGRR